MSEENKKNIRQGIWESMKCYFKQNPISMESLKTGIILPSDAKWEPCLERLKTITVKPGDYLVIEVEEYMSDTAHAHVQEIMSAHGFHCLILEKSRLKAILRKEKMVGGIDFGMNADEVPGR